MPLPTRSQYLPVEIFSTLQLQCEPDKFHKIHRITGAAWLRLGDMLFGDVLGAAGQRHLSGEVCHHTFASRSCRDNFFITFFPSSHSHPQPFGHRTFKGTTGVEGAHGELRPGLPHALRCNGATGMPDSSQFAGRRKVFTSAVHGSSWYILFEEDRLLCDLSKV